MIINEVQIQHLQQEHQLHQRFKLSHKHEHEVYINHEVAISERLCRSEVVQLFKYTERERDSEKVAFLALAFGKLYAIPPTLSTPRAYISIHPNPLL